MHRIRPYSNEPQNIMWMYLGIEYAPAEWRLGEAMDPNVDMFSPEGLEKLLYEETKNKYEPHASKDATVVPPLKLLSDENDELQTIRVELEKYITESRIRFITGDLDIEKEWDGYIKNLDSVGLQKYLEIRQKAYDRQYK